MTFQIGVAGCGRMGLPMAQALHRAGFDTLGFDVRSADTYTSFDEQMCFDPAAFVAKRNVLMTMVRDINLSCYRQRNRHNKTMSAYLTYCRGLYGNV